MPSTVISAIRYDAMSQTLRVTYLSGIAYDYLKVPEAVYKEMKSVINKGTYLNFHIKGKYDYKRIDGQ